MTAEINYAVGRTTTTYATSAVMTAANTGTTTSTHNSTAEAVAVYAGA